MKKFITKAFDEKLTNLFSSKPEVLNFLINHERKHISIGNLEREINKLENTHIRLDLKKLTMIVRDFANMFAHAALINKEQSIMSSAEKYRQVKEYDEQQQLQAELEKTYNESTTRTEEFNSVN